MPTIVHFDINAKQPARLKSFYESLFGWKIEALPGIEDYYFVETTGLDGKKGIGGGISRRTSETWTGITDFIGVSSIDDALEKVRELGGKVVVPRRVITGFGYNAICSDPEGNVIGLFQEDSNALL